MRKFGLWGLLAALFYFAFPVTARAGGPITSGQVVSGTLSSPNFNETWTFSGTNGQRVLISAVTTSGAVNTLIRLKNPGGTEVIATGADRVDYQLLATGTYTIIVEDSGLNDAGTYNLGFLNVIAGPLTSGSDPDGGAIASAEVKTGQMHQAGDFDAFTFSGTTGDRVLFTALTTSGSLNTILYLYPPNGGAAETNTGGGDRLDAQLAATGTYTVVIEDGSLLNTGAYRVNFLNLTAGPLSNGADSDGGNIASAEVKAGAFTSAPDFDAWRFTGTNGQRILISAVMTGGAGNTVTYLYPPGGGSAVIASGADRTDYQLNASGTWTIVIEDSAQDELGTYNLSLLNVTAGPLTSGSDPDGGAIASAEVKTGQMHQAGDFDGFTFSGTAGDRVLFTALTTSGSLNTIIYLYPPNGGPAETNTGGGDRLDVQLAATGTYTVVIQDASLLNTGAYRVSLLNVTAGPLSNGSDADGGNIASAEVKSAAFTSAPDFDAWRFTGSNGQRVLISAVMTGGAGNTVTYLYPPGGGSAVIASGADRTDYQLNASGTWTIVIEDAAQDELGTYNLSLLNVTGGPLSNGSDPDGGAIASAEVKTGQMHQVGDFDAFTFSGTAGDRIVFAGLVTSGTFNTILYLYPPNGGPAETNTGGGDRLDAQLGATGTYTVVIQDASLINTGSYRVSLLNLTAGPLSNGADPDGGNIASAEVKSGAFTSAPDFDAWHFSGTSGQRILVSAVMTGGAGNTVTYLYPPSGGPAVVASGADRSDYQLNASGTWTILVEDAAQDELGTYNLSLLNVTAGPLSNGADPDGGAIASAEVKTGQMHQTGDFDAFTFNGTTGDRILFSALTTSGSLNTMIFLYPPNGGPAETNTGGGDRLDVQLGATGTYTLVIQDASLVNTGAYRINLLNLTAGPLSNGADPDGGNIASAEVKSGAFTSAPDFDAWRFTGTNGQRVLVSAVLTGGAGNTVTYLYPPSGGPAVVASGADRSDYQLNASGTWTIVIEDANQDELGTYNLSLLNVTAGPLSNGSDTDGGAIASAEVKTGQMQQTGDFDAFTFSGTAGDRIVCGCITTSGSLNTTIFLYPPNGGAAETNTGGGDRLDAQLDVTGTYTLVIQDASLTSNGLYSIALMNVSAGPFTTGSDGDGGVIATGYSHAGLLNPTPDFDAYRFTGAAGDTAKISAIATSGTINTTIYLYPPNGGAAVVATGTDNVTHVLTLSGNYTIVIQDAPMTSTGGYNFTFNKSGGTSGVGQEDAFDPTRVVVTAAYPNPFSAGSSVGFSLPETLPVRARVFDANGALVRTLTDEDVSAGMHRLDWDGRDAHGRVSPSGIYYLELQTGTSIARQRLVRLK